MTSGTAKLTEGAAALDAADPLARFRSRFTDAPGVVAYLDGNSLGRPVATLPETVTAFLDEQWGGRLIRGWDEGWMDAPTELGDTLGRLVLGAGPGQTVVADSTTVMLYKLARAAVTAQPGRTEIITDTENFPTDRFVLEGIAAECGLTIRWVTPDRASGVTVADIEALLSPRTALVQLSHVAYKSAFIADLAAITATAHDAGALVLWDLCHSVGAVELALDAAGVDLAAGCTYKYLNGGPGSPSFGYVNRSLHDRLRQPITGWMGAADPFAMDDPYRPATGIRRIISGTPPITAMLPMRAMLALIEEAGMPAIRRKSVALTRFAIELYDELLADAGATLASPRDAALRGSHVTIEHPEFHRIVKLLWGRGVIPDFRPPAGIRIGLSPLSTSFTEVALGVEAIAAELHSSSTQ